MSKSGLIFFFFLSFSMVARSEIPPRTSDFLSVLRQYLVSLSPSDVHFIHDGAQNNARPNYNWSYAYGSTPVCTFQEVKKIRNAMGPAAFAEYGEYIDFGWLYDQQNFEYSLRHFAVILKKDKSSEAKVISALVDNALKPEAVAQQKKLIQYEISKNEDRLSEISGLTKEQVRTLVFEYSRRFNSCLGRYQTGYINLTNHLLNH